MLLSCARLVEGLPARMVHAPVPGLAEFAASTCVPVMHIEKSFPAFAVAGGATQVITTLSVVAVQGALLMVQRSVYAPATMGLGVNVALLAEVLLNWVREFEAPPGTEMMDHAPVPVAGVVAANVAAVVDVQCV